MQASQTYEQRATLSMLAQEEHEFRMRRLERDVPDAATMLNESVRVLELNLAIVAIQEAMSQLGLKTLGEAIAAHERVDGLAETLSRLDVARIMGENVAALRTANAPTAPDTPLGVDIRQVARAVQSLLLHCPIDEIEAGAGSDPSLVPLAHRCRMAFDGLTAFVTRHLDPKHDAIIAAGHAYAEDRVSVGEVAAMLGLTVPDAVALLEAHGFRRSVEALRLTDTERAERLRAIREERIARGGVPHSSPELVNRDVIASQRIEGIDARPWLPRD